MRSFMRFRNAVNSSTRSASLICPALVVPEVVEAAAAEVRPPRPRGTLLASAAEQRLELALAMQRHHVVVATHVDLADEDLRHRGAARARDHAFALDRIQVDAHFLPLQVTAAQEVLRGHAVAADRAGVDDDRRLRVRRGGFIGHGGNLVSRVWVQWWIRTPCFSTAAGGTLQTINIGFTPPRRCPGMLGACAAASKQPPGATCAIASPASAPYWSPSCWYWWARPARMPRKTACPTSAHPRAGCSDRCSRPNMA